MSKKKKHRQSEKSQKADTDIISVKNYAEDSIISNTSFSCNIKETCSFEGIKAARVEIPYPKIQVESKNKYYAELLSNDLCGMVSELSAITQYINHEIRLSTSYCNVSRTVLSIAQTEMMHLQMIGELILLLGEPLDYNSYNNGKIVPWNPSFVDFGNDISNMILADIKDEYKAIIQYEGHIKKIDDQCIKVVLERIIKDEEYHIELLTSLLDESSLCSTNNCIN